MTDLAGVAALLKSARQEAGFTQAELAARAGVARSTVVRMETLARDDMSVGLLLRLLEAAGHQLKVVPRGHGRTLEDVLREQREAPSAT
jgi:transcriptional regulator with XRE-family HTH domain